MTHQVYTSQSNLCESIFREMFKFYGKSEDYLIHGLTFFQSFPDLYKNQNFDILKAYLFYFAYRTKRFGSPLVKELLTQEYLNAQIVNPEEYLDFCMYCFYKGLYYIEKRNFFIATYLYCSAVEMGISNDSERIIVFNEFTIQMIRSLCFLKVLSDFDINSHLFKKSRYNNFKENVNYDDIDDCFSFLNYDTITLEKFISFVNSNKEMYINNKLIGLKNEAEEMLILKKIRDSIKVYKKIKLTKLSQSIKIDFNYLLKVIKKKCLSGELNVKYDEETDVIEVFDIDPGMKERVKKTQEIFKDIIEANKNNFINLRDKKLLDLHKSNIIISDEELDI